MDNGATDSSGDSCIWYEQNHQYCGDYDDDDFVAEELCCPCKSNGNLEASVIIWIIINILIIEQNVKNYRVIQYNLIWIDLFKFRAIHVQEVIVVPSINILSSVVKLTWRLHALNLQNAAHFNSARKIEVVRYVQDLKLS